MKYRDDVNFMTLKLLAYVVFNKLDVIGLKLII